jgi:mutator protein MutT
MEQTDGLMRGVVAVIPKDGKLLAIRRAEGIRAGGWWCFPGGGIEAGETIEAALVREIDEELGVRVVPRQQLWQWLRPDGELLLYWWLADLVDAADVIRPSPAEVAEARWVTPAQFARLHPVLESNLQFLEHYKPSCDAA